MKYYTYSVARVRSKEASLLTRADIDQLLSSESYDSALRTVRDHGYPAREGEDFSEVTSAARQELWAFIEELCGDETLRILRLPVDYHNIKASVKSVFSRVDGSDLLLPHGTVDGKLILEGVRRREYGDLDPQLVRVCEEALALLLRTQDGQACDIYVDRAMLEAIGEVGRESHDDFIRGYAELTIDLANIRTAWRCAISERSLSFVENALCEGGSLKTAELAAAAAQGLDALMAVLSPLKYGDCVAAMKLGAAQFERWCGDERARYVDAARWDNFSAAPIIAYYCAKSAEIDALRLILSGKRNRLDNDRIRERVPGIYG